MSIEDAMRLGSACSGVGCIDLGLERAGFEPAWQIEIDSTCRDVLARHWPDVERLEDLKDAARTTLPRVDLIAGGTPCQDLSVAGKGAGLDGERSGIFFDFVRLADSQPWAFVLWENVAGALSSNSGRDFALVLEGFAGVGFGVPPEGWRNAGVAFGPLRWVVWWLADAQYFGVAQRRRRVYLVAGPRGRCGPEVLLESEGVRGDPPPSREAGTRSAGILAGGSNGRGWRCGADEAAGGALVVDEVQITTHPENRANPKPGDPSPTLAGTGRPMVYSLQDSPEGQNGLGVSEDQSYALTGRDRHAVYQCHGSNVGPMGTLRKGNGNEAGGSCGTGPRNLVMAFEPGSIASREAEPARPAAAPRRLVPVETERLQGLPDHWTRYRADGSEIADGPRYRMIGNGAAVPHVEFIGRRLMKALA